MWGDLIQPIASPPVTEDSFHAFCGMHLLSTLLGLDIHKESTIKTHLFILPQDNIDLTFYTWYWMPCKKRGKGPDNDDDLGEELLSKLT